MAVRGQEGAEAPSHGDGPMIFQCSDLERALQHPELMPDARAHAEQCEECRQQLYLWSEISNAAACLHQEWDSPALWPKIQAELEAKARESRRPPVWRWMAAVAAVVLIAAGISIPWRRHKSQPTGAFLTEEALHDVQQAEKVYAASIARLAAVAEKD